MVKREGFRAQGDGFVREGSRVAKRVYRALLLSECEPLNMVPENKLVD